MTATITSLPGIRRDARTTRPNDDDETLAEIREAFGGKAPGVEVPTVPPATPPTQQTDWNPLTELDAQWCDESFPVHALPPAAADMVEAVATSIEVPPDMPAMAALGALATVSQGKIRVQEDVDYFEPTNLFIATMAEPGERKSAIHGQMLDGIVGTIEREHNEAHAAAIRQSNARVQTLQSALERAKRAVSRKNPPDDIYAAEADIVVAQQALDEYTPVRPLRLMADDATPEAVVSLLAANSGAISIVTPEGGVFKQVAGRYTGVPNFDPYLKGHAGDSIRVDRKGREPEYIQNPALSMVLAVQPQILRDIGKKEDFRGVGLLARFLYAYPKSIVGERLNDPDPVPEPIRLAYNAQLRLVSGQVNALTAPVALTLHADARATWKAFGNDVEIAMRPGQALSDIRDWASKLAGAVLRIAGLLHIGAHGLAATRVISVTTMQAAVAIGRYLIPHAQTAFAVMTGQRSSNDARHLLAWADDRAIHTHTIKAIRASIKSWTEERVVDAANMLVDHGYARVVEWNPATTKGRYPGQTIEFRPIADRKPVAA